MKSCQLQLASGILLLCLHFLHATDYKNIYGNDLESCSEPNNNMALTGYTRSGSCVERQDDSGSHHICIDLSSTTGGNFCTVTGQSDWCSSYMACDSGGYADDEDVCPVVNWCVCQWAFASYVENAGGCDYIQDIKCEAINVEAVKAYASQSGRKYSNALECIESRCAADFTSYRAARAVGGMRVYGIGGILFAFCVFLAFGIIRLKSLSKTSEDNNAKLSLASYDATLA